MADFAKSPNGFVVKAINVEPAGATQVAEASPADPGTILRPHPCRAAARNLPRLDRPFRGPLPPGQCPGCNPNPGPGGLNQGIAGVSDGKAVPRDAFG